MDITIPKNQLQRALSLVQNIVEKKSTIPILANVLLIAKEGHLRVAAMDMEMAAVVKVPATIRHPGKTTINARVLTELVKELPDTDVTLKLLEGDRLDITARSSRTKVVGINADEYPQLTGMDIVPGNKIPAAQLLDMINKTLYAVSYDETRFTLNGVCLELLDDGSLRLVATDGHRLAFVTRPCGTIRFEDRVIVPRKGIQEIRKLLDEQVDGEVAIEVAMKEGLFVVETSDAKLAMRLIDGEFPDYHQVVPTGPGTVAVVDNGEFVGALRRVALMVSDKTKCVKLDFSPTLLRISSSSSELGEAKEELAVEYSGEPLSIGFNARYLVDIAASFGEDQRLAIELHGDVGPGRFYPASDESCVGIVMPMRL
jgi:DNA polymerase-3 subunit beta